MSSRHALRARVLAWCRARRFTLTGIALVLTALSLAPPGWSRCPSWCWAALALAFVLCWVALGALELALVVLVSSGAGLTWALRVQAHFGGLPAPIPLSGGLALGTALAFFLVQARQRVYQGGARGGAPVAEAIALGAALLGAASGLDGLASAALAVLPTVSALVFAPLGTDVLFYRAPNAGTPRLKHLLGGAWVFLYLFLAQVLLLVVVAPLLRVLSRDRDGGLTRVRELSRAGARGLFRWFPYGRLDLVGVTAGAFARPAVVVSNHQSSVDIPLVLSLPGDVRLTLKRRVWDAPYLGKAARRLGHVLVEKDDPETTLERCRAVLDGGGCAHFFPEGTRSEDDYPRRFHRGAFDVAVQLGRDVVPVVLCATDMCVPRDAHWVEDFHTVVKVLPPITPLEFDYSLGSRALMKHAQELIREEYLVEHDRIHTASYLARRVRRLYRYQGRRVARSVDGQLADEWLLGVLGRVMPAEGRVLDLHCGVAVLANWLRLKYPRLSVHAFDDDERALRTARSSSSGTTRMSFHDGGAEGWELGAADGAVLRPREGSLGQLLGRLAVALAPGAPLVLTGRAPARDVLARHGFDAHPTCEGVYVRGASA